MCPWTLWIELDLLLHLKAARRSCATVLDSWRPPASAVDSGKGQVSKVLQTSLVQDQELLPLPLPLPPFFAVTLETKQQIGLPRLLSCRRAATQGMGRSHPSSKITCGWLLPLYSTSPPTHANKWQDCIKCHLHRRVIALGD